MKFKAPAPKYLGPAAHQSAGSNLPVHRIVIHSTVSPTRAGGARDTAAYFRSSRAGGSAHYVVDPYETVQCVYDSKIAWHAPPNAHSIGIELCDMPHPTSSKRWSDAEHRLLFERAAELVAQLCLAYDVPAWYVSSSQLRRGKRGVTTHRQVSLAFGQSSHWDPGAWPRVRFMLAVRRHKAAIAKAAKR